MLVFATNNRHKLDEIRKITGDDIVISGLSEMGIKEDIPEEEPTLEGNAAFKARYIFEKYGHDCFADDTGLEVETLDGRPGVKSARYAGPECIAGNNIRKLLKELDGKDNRKARFRTIIALVWKGVEYHFEGIVNGVIIDGKRGTDGFGYDPVFLPEGYDQTFAEMPMDLKNRISHRGIATVKLVTFLKQLQS
jgi:XTP/dITP diphosphohydrolase